MDKDRQNNLDSSTNFVSFRRLRLPLGLIGSRKTFQSPNEHVLSGITLKTCVTYSDDCLIFPITAKKPISRLRAIFPTLLRGLFQIKLSRCSSFLATVWFVGHSVSKNRLQVDPKKIKDVIDFPTSKN